MERKGKNYEEYFPPLSINIRLGGKLVSNLVIFCVYMY